MKKNILWVIFAYLMSFAMQASAATINIQVKDSAGALISGATVYAIFMRDNGPDPDASQVVVSTAGGAFFTGLGEGNWYDFLAASHGKGPTAVRQAQGQAAALHMAVNGAMGNHTLNLNETLSNVGTVIADVTGASASKMIFGDITKDGRSSAYGACLTDGAGACAMFFVNVASSIANAYLIGVFDPNSGLGGGTVVNSALNTDGTVNIGVSMANANAPDLSASAGDQNSDAQQRFETSQGGISVEGLIHEVGIPTMTVPYSGISLKVKSLQNGTTNVYDQGWSNADQNGRFKFYGLTNGTTYYLSVMGGCRQDGICYEGYQSTRTEAGGGNDPGPNDFLFYSSSPLFHKVKLTRTAAGTGQIRVYVKDTDNNPVYRSWVSLSDDWNQYHTSATNTVAHNCSGSWDSADVSSNPFSGYQNAEASTGTYLFKNLRAGNYRISTCGGNGCKTFNDGLNGTVVNNSGAPGSYSFPGCNSTTADDLRVNLDGSGNLRIYNTSGTLVMTSTAAAGESMYTSSITINLPARAPGGARLFGTLTFPSVVNLANDPVAISIHGGGPGCDYYTVIGDTEAPASTYTYDIYPTTSTSCGNNGSASYWLEIQGGYWGRVSTEEGSDNRISFDNTLSVRKDLKFAAAGRWIGKVYKPDGSVFTRSTRSQNYVTVVPSARLADGGHGHAQTPANEDGTFVLGGLLPGKYEQRVQMWGSAGGAYALANPAPTFDIKPNQDTYQDLNLVSAQWVAFSASTNSLNLPVLKSSAVDNMGGRAAGDSYVGYSFPVGQKFDFTMISKLLTNELEDAQFVNIPRLQSSPCNSGSWIGGWCPRRLPTGQAYDFYFFRTGETPDGGVTIPGIDNNYKYFTVIGSSKNIPVDSAHASSPLVCNGGYQAVTSVDAQAHPIGEFVCSPGGPVQHDLYENILSSVNANLVPAVHVNMTPGTPVSSGVVVTGTVIGQNIFRRVDFENLGGSFANFVKLLPIVTLTDADRELKAAGLVTPPINLIDQNMAALDQSIADSNFDEFYRLFVSSFTQAYEIRGVQPGRTYTLTAQTQNYPPYTTTINVGTAGSTTTVNINFDTQVGAGASLDGVVSSTAGVISGAVVLIESPAMPKSLSLVTSSTGSYKTEAGLGAGLYKITVTADGFATAKKEVSVSGSGAVTTNFTMTFGAGRLEGTVREMGLKSVGIDPVTKKPIKIKARVPVSGARVIAYNDSSAAGVAITPYATETSTNGTYSFTGLVPGQTYKVFAKAQGRQPLVISTVATSGLVSGVDFLLQPKPLDIKVSAHQGNTAFEITIGNPNDFKEGSARYEDAAGGFQVANSTDISDSFVVLPDSSIVASIPLGNLAANTPYILRVEAEDFDDSTPTFIKEITFGKGFNDTVQESIDDELSGDPDDSTIDSQDASLDFGVGTMESSTTAGSLPSATLTAQTTAAAAAQGVLGYSAMAAKGSFSGAFKSDIFELALSSVQFNAGRKVSLKLPCIQDAASVASLAPFYFNTTSQKWEKLSITLTVNPDGTCSLPLDLSTLSGYGAASMSRYGMASADGARGSMNSTQLRNGSFAYNPMALNSGSGAFMVGVAQAGGVSAGGTYKQYNFPNPFNLKAKTVTLRGGTAGVNATVMGTYIVVAPTGSGTVNIKIRIYNLAGDLVKTLETTGTGGQYNYIAWDGVNTSNQQVASGVYFAVVDAPGSDRKKPVKMVIVK